MIVCGMGVRSTDIGSEGGGTKAEVLAVQPIKYRVIWTKIVGVMATHNLGVSGRILVRIFLKKGLNYEQQHHERSSNENWNPCRSLVRRGVSVLNLQ